MVESNGEAILPAPLSPASERPLPDAKTSLGDRRRIFKQIIVKCVLQLLLIETTNDLLRNDEVYKTIPPEHLLRLMSVLDHSYQFAREFNEDKDLRTGLWKVGGCYFNSSRLNDHLLMIVIRFHETFTQPSQTGVEQCCDISTRSITHVL